MRKGDLPGLREAQEKCAGKGDQGALGTCTGGQGTGEVHGEGGLRSGAGTPNGRGPLCNRLHEFSLSAKLVGFARRETTNGAYGKDSLCDLLCELSRSCETRLVIVTGKHSSSLSERARSRAGVRVREKSESESESENEPESERESESESRSESEIDSDNDSEGESESESRSKGESERTGAEGCGSWGLGFGWAVFWP